MLLTASEAKELIDRILKFSSTDEMRVNLSGSRRGNTRFAINSITTSSDIDEFSIRVTSCFGTRRGTATTSETDDAALLRAIRRAEDLARYSPEDPEYVPELGPQRYATIHAFFETTAGAGPELRSRQVLSCMTPANQKNLNSAGFAEHSQHFDAVGNSRGLFAYHRATDASFTATVRTADGTGSGWASSDARDVERVEAARVSAEAIRKAERSAKPSALEPGQYSVVLEPQAVADFLIFALFAMNARSADEGRSFYAKPGGGNKIGEKVAGENIMMRSDPTNRHLLGSPFAADGMPNEPIVWIENGVLRNLNYDRYWAAKQGKAPTMSPVNVILEGGGVSIDEMIRSTQRGILVTRFWYIRFVDPKILLLTGLTRDGLFLIERGRTTKPIKNFRFNESPIAVLNNVEMLGRPERVGNSLVPAIKATGFTFSSLSEAV